MAPENLPLNNEHANANLEAAHGLFGPIRASLYGVLALLDRVDDSMGENAGKSEDFEAAIQLVGVTIENVGKVQEDIEHAQAALHRSPPPARP